MLGRLVLGVCTAAVSTAVLIPRDVNGDMPFITVNFRECPAYYVLGQSLVINSEFRYKPAGDGGIFHADFGYDGLPYGMWFKLFDARGHELPRFPSAGPGPGPGRPDAKEVFRLWLHNGESLQLSTDLINYFKVSEPGFYDVELFNGQEPRPRRRILVLPQPTDQTFPVKGQCDSPARDVNAMNRGMVSCNVKAGKSVGADGKTYWLVVVSDVNATLYDANMLKQEIPALQIAAPQGVRVEKAELDFKWHLWTVLTAEGKRALVIWDLHTGNIQTAIPWCDDEIEIGATLLGPSSLYMLVAAGRKGGTRMTSLSVP